MKQMERRAVIRYSVSIVFWLSFLVLSTMFFYLPKQNLQNSFAYLQQNNEFYLEELNDGFHMESVYPVSDDIGKQGDPLLFQIVNRLDKNISYELYFRNNDSKISQMEKKLDNRYLRYQLLENGEEVMVGNLPSDGKILIANVSAHTNNQYEFRLWLDQDSDMGFLGKEFCGVLGLDPFYPEQADFAADL